MHKELFAVGAKVKHVADRPGNVALIVTSHVYGDDPMARIVGYNCRVVEPGTPSFRVLQFSIAELEPYPVKPHAGDAAEFDDAEFEPDEEKAVTTLTPNGVKSIVRLGEVANDQNLFAVVLLRGVAVLLGISIEEVDAAPSWPAVADMILKRAGRKS